MGALVVKPQRGDEEEQINSTSASIFQEIYLIISQSSLFEAADHEYLVWQGHLPCALHSTAGE